jgi:hypothetical protein
MAKLLKNLLEEILEEAGDELGGTTPDMPVKPAKPTPSSAAGLPDDEEEPEEENLKDHAPDGKGHYSPDDLREIVDYVYTIIEKENGTDGESGDDEDDDGKKKSNDMGEVGLDLIYEYADLLPETVINQIVDDLKGIFEIDDTMLESIVNEGSAFFTKSKKGPVAQAAAKLTTDGYKKNKGKIKKRNTVWRGSDIGKKIAELHKKVWKGAGKMKGKRAVAVGE